MRVAAFAMRKMSSAKLARYCEVRSREVLPWTCEERNDSIIPLSMPSDLAEAREYFEIHSSMVSAARAAMERASSRKRDSLVMRPGRRYFLVAKRICLATEKRTEDTRDSQEARARVREMVVCLDMVVFVKK